MDYKVPNVVREYVAALTDEELKWLLMRIEQGFAGDSAEVLMMVQRNEAMDGWFKSARGHAEFFSLLDVLHYQLDFESRRRGK